MISKFMDKWESRRSEIEDLYSTKHPESYSEIVREAINLLRGDSDDDENYDESIPDPERIHSIDDGHYQGTLLFVIGAKGYQPSTYWFVKINYGSCSGCDWLEGTRGYSDEKPSKEQTDEYVRMVAHVIQGLKPMQEEDGEF